MYALECTGEAGASLMELTDDTAFPATKLVLPKTGLALAEQAQIGKPVMLKQSSVSDAKPHLF